MKFKTTTHCRFLCMLIILLAFNLACYAQNSQIKGLLSNEDNLPVEYASVSLLSVPDSTILKGTFSDQTGMYQFRNVKPGIYIVKITSVGYPVSVSNQLTIKSQDVEFNMPVIHLQSLKGNLQTINVRGSKPLIERKAGITIVNVENSILAAGNSVMEILEKLPGVKVEEDKISLNGKKEVAVMINDKLTYLSPAQLAALLRSTNGSTVRSIEVITAPSAKYDAAGNSGVINIKLKNNSKPGTNVNVVLGIAAGKFLRDNSGISINHKAGKLNVFASYNRSDNKRFRDVHLDRSVDDGNTGRTLFLQHAEVTGQDHNNSYKAGADYNASAKNTIGFVVSGYSNSHLEHNNGMTIIGPAGSIDSTLRTTTGISGTFRNIAFNLNDKFVIDTTGQELTVDVDYSKFNNSSNAMYENYFFSANGNKLHDPLILTNFTPSNINIRAVKADYVKPLNQTLKLEAGLKYSDVQSDNNLIAQISDKGTLVNDIGRTNHFIYNEKISAGYVNLKREWKNTSVQLGLRSEYTSSNGNLLGINEINRHYFDLFPSAFINQVLNAKNEISFSYGRRIDRPGYDDLNPFTYNLDPFTQVQGNAFLSPQYTHNFEVSYTYNKTIIVGASYSHINDAISTLILPSGNKIIETQRNFQSREYYGLNVFAPYHITSWWSGNVSGNGFYQSFTADNITNSKLSNGKASFIAKTTQSFVFGEFKAEVMGSYSSSSVEGISFEGKIYYVDAGFSRSFAGKKANLKFAVNDIFNTRKYSVGSHLLSNDYLFTSKSDSRIARLTFTYDFGNKKIKNPKHATGLEDEASRVRSGN